MRGKAAKSVPNTDPVQDPNVVLLARGPLPVEGKWRFFIALGKSMRRYAKKIGEGIASIFGEQPQYKNADQETRGFVLSLVGDCEACRDRLQRAISHLLKDLGFNKALVSYQVNVPLVLSLLRPANRLTI